MLDILAMPQSCISPKQAGLVAPAKPHASEQDMPSGFASARFNPTCALKKLLYLGLITLLPTIASADDTWRCGQKLVSLGDRSFEVQQKCGAPALRDTVGYTTDYNGNQQLQIEEWVYGPPNGAYYILTFTGSKLTAIEFRRGQ